MALKALLPSFLIIAKAVKKSKDKLLSNGKLDVIVLFIRNLT